MGVLGISRRLIQRQPLANSVPLVFNSLGQPRIAYQGIRDGVPNGPLKYAVFDGSDWDLYTIDASRPVEWISAALSPVGQLVVAYQDDLEGDLIIASQGELVTP